MAKETKDIQQGLDALPPEVLKEVFKEQQDFIDDIFNYKLDEELDDFSQPLTMKEKRELKKYDLQNVESEKDIDGLIMDIAKLRGVEDEIVDDQAYSELNIWVRKICFGTYNLRKAVKK